MNKLVITILILGIFLIGCTSNVYSGNDFYIENDYIKIEYHHCSVNEKHKNLYDINCVNEDLRSFENPTDYPGSSSGGTG